MFFNIRGYFEISVFDKMIYSISLVIRQSFSFQTNPKDLDPSYKGKTSIIAKFDGTDLVICSYPRDKKPCLTGISE